MTAYGCSRRVILCFGLFLGMCPLPNGICQAAEPVKSTEVSQPHVSPGEGFRYLGKVKPRHARDIRSSNWSVGAETMDRDYTVYKHWKEYLGPLGIKKARIQSGWAKTEKTRGNYSWEWIDEIVFDMVDQGVEPWVCLYY